MGLEKLENVTPAASSSSCLRRAKKKKQNSWAIPPPRVARMRHFCGLSAAARAGRAAPTALWLWLRGQSTPTPRAVPRRSSPVGLGLARPLALQHPLPHDLRPVSFLPRRLQGPHSTGGPGFPGQCRASSWGGTAPAASGNREACPSQQPRPPPPPRPSLPPSPAAPPSHRVTHPSWAAPGGSGTPSTL